MTHRNSEPPETGASSPSSQHASQTGARTSKDRDCPFCGQAFTSSSLGRHLDLYIKPKNPKPPDGVHHADEIRRMRGGITRRQPKTTLKEGANIDASGWRQPSAEGTPVAAPSTAPSSSRGLAPAPIKINMKIEGRALDASPVMSPFITGETEVLHSAVNTPNWQATGVINNLPLKAASRDNAPTPTGQAQRIQEMRRGANGIKVPRPDYEFESMVKLQEAAEVGRAAELALREVLGGLEAAKKRLEPKQLFPGVDFFALSFPGLCLAILPAPTTLFCPTPFPGGESWTLAPPGRKQFETINLMMHQRINVLQERSREDFPDTLVFKQQVHFGAAFENWQIMSERERVSAWTLETLRAYSTAADHGQEVKLELEAAQNRIRHLEAEYDRLSRCQLPREYLVFPPNTIPAPAAVVKEMQNVVLRSEAAEMNYDVDALLGKWRTAIKATTRRPTVPLPTQEYNYNSPIYHESSKGSTEHMGNDMVMSGAVFGVNGVMPRVVGAPSHDPSHVYYDTPPRSGVVVGAEDNLDDLDADAEGEADIDHDEVRHFGSYSGPGALGRQTRSSHLDGTLNMNGKRPLPPARVYGNSVGAKARRTRDDNDG
ncbi:hypothetical protein LTR08_001197 [Meristemomyces frigidus]|nr:hypothetical protein LTR08_001197 [Meristemomyces frigidus]